MISNPPGSQRIATDPGPEPDSILPSPLLVLVGPTASGKTEFALELASRLGAEILCADSVQLRRGMDIGSGKVTAEQRARAPHHGLDLVGPDEPFDAARFAAHGRDILAGIAKRGRPAIVVVGTGLYLRALLHGLVPAPPKDAGLRDALEAEARRLGSEALHARLAQVDSELAARLSPRDLPRIVRGLEVFTSTGTPLSRQQRAHAFAACPFRTATFGLAWERPVLRERIAARCRAMLAAGLLDEVRALRAAGFGPELEPMRALGYRHMNLVLDGQLDLPAALELQIRDTRRYARRQMTWFAADSGTRWLQAPHDAAQVLAEVRACFGWESTP